MENSYNSQQPNYQPNIIMVGKQKSSGTAILLAFIFGPLGLLYVSVAGGIVLTLISVFFFWTFIVPVICWIASIIWAVMGANAANEKATAQAAQMMQQQAPPVYQQHTHVNFANPQTTPPVIETPNQQIEVEKTNVADDLI